MTNQRFLNEDLKVWSYYDITDETPRVRIDTGHLHFNCGPPQFDVPFASGEIKQIPVYEEVIRNGSQVEQIETVKIAVESSSKATFEWTRALEFNNKIDALLPQEFQTEDFSSITVGTLGKEHFGFKHTLPHKITIRTQPGKTLKLKIYAEEKTYRSNFSIVITPKDEDVHRIQNVTARIDGHPDKRGNLKAIFKHLADDFPGYTTDGAFIAQGVCDIKRTLRHRHEITPV